MTNRIVWVTRHGERLDNIDRKWMKHCDSKSTDDPPLADRGRVQARELAERLAKESNIAHIFSSPFRRCVETAHIVAEKLGKAVNVEPGICEVLWNHPPGYLNVEELKQKFSSVNRDYVPAAEHYRMDQHDSESYDSDVFKRVGAAVSTILSRFPEGEILFVGHGASVAGILKQFTNQPSYVGLCTLSRLEQQSAKWKAIFVGNAGHLSDKTNLRAY